MEKDGLTYTIFGMLFRRTLLLSFVCSALVVAAAPPYDSNIFAGLHWRMIGPFRGGRVNGVTGVPGRPHEYYFGSVGGGVWKSINDGRTWTPVFDSQPIASIGAIGVSASNPDVVYVGTGEADMRSQNSFGNGMYKSTDGGRSWTHIGLDNTRQIGRVLVNPRDPNVVFVAALGHVYGANPDRGVYRTRDGGATWEKVLFKNDNVGAIDLAFDPVDPAIVYATLWNTRRPPWSIYPPSYGPGSGLFKSTDGGSTWQPLTNGLPNERVGRIGVAVAPSNRSRVYAIVDAKDGGLYRSDDAGATWKRMSNDARIWGRGWYFCKVVVDPKNPETVYVSNTSVYKSSDGGARFTAIKGAPGGDDYHQLWIAPDDPDRMILGSDQGAVVTVDGAKTWSSWYNQPTAQMYNVDADNRFPYWVTGAQQDSGAVGTPTSSDLAEISMHDWKPMCAGGESGYTAADPLHPTILFGGTVERCNTVTGQTWNVTPEKNLPTPPRHTWTLPLVFSHADEHVLFFSDQYIFKTMDGGDRWTRISDDLTRENPGVPPNLDEATSADAPQTARRGVVYTLAPSPLDVGLLWAGTDDGLIHVTHDGGKAWQNVTPPSLTPWSKVVMLEASHFDAAEAYAAIDRHRLSDNEPHVYRTKDGGKTWQTITTGLPAGVYLQTIKEDPKRRGLLFAGTELGVFVSFDDGDSWQTLQLNLPPVSVRDIEIHGGDVIVATHGRGFWVLDDIGALRQLTPETMAGPAFLFRPSDAVKIPEPSEQGTPQPRDEPFGENPHFGAVVDYYVKSAAGPVTLEIVDAQARSVRRWSSDDQPETINPDTLQIPAFWVHPAARLSADAGLHRWYWDFRYAPDAHAAPPEAGDRRRRGEEAASGTYTVKLTVGGKTYTQPLVVKPDPRVLKDIR